MAWRPAPAILTFLAEVNALAPHRNKASDGIIGDAAHAASASDHNPNVEGVVCAIDITHDPANGVDIAVLYEYLRTHPHPNQKYIIANGRIASRAYDWRDRPYFGDPHTNHLHTSVGVGTDGHSAPGTYNDTSPWLVGFGGNQTVPQHPPVSSEEDMPAFLFIVPDGRVFAVPRNGSKPWHIKGEESLAAFKYAGVVENGPSRPVTGKIADQLVEAAK